MDGCVNWRRHVLALYHEAGWPVAYIARYLNVSVEQVRAALELDP